jgi:hypothetical protein
VTATGPLAFLDPSANLGLFLRDLGVVLGALVALRTLWAAAKVRYGRTLGRRRDLYDRLARLGVGAQLSFFEAVIGEPPAIKRAVPGKTLELVTFEPTDREAATPGTRRWWRRRRPEDEEAEDPVVERPKDFTESIFLDRYFFLQTISDESQTVQAFSVTTRHRRFKPTFTGLREEGALRRFWFRVRHGEKAGRLFKIELGRTTFAELDEPHFIRAWVGARPAAYSEAHGGGNPTYYQTFVLTASTAAAIGPAGPLLEIAAALEHGDWSPGGDSSAPDEFEDIPGIDEFRQQTAITTYSVLAFSPDMYPDTTFGPHGDEVRTLP